MCRQEVNQDVQELKAEEEEAAEEEAAEEEAAEEEAEKEEQQAEPEVHWQVRDEEELREQRFKEEWETTSSS